MKLKRLKQAVIAILWIAWVIIVSDLIWEVFILGKQ